MPQAGLTGSEAAEAINSFGALALAPSLVPQSWSWEPEEGKGTGMVLIAETTLALAWDVSCSYHPTLPAGGLTSRLRPLRGLWGEGEDFGQARGAERVLVLASLSQAA